MTFGQETQTLRLLMHHGWNFYPSLSLLVPLLTVDSMPELSWLCDALGAVPAQAFQIRQTEPASS